MLSHTQYSTVLVRIVGRYSRTYPQMEVWYFAVLSVISVISGLCSSGPAEHLVEYQRTGRLHISRYFRLTAGIGTYTTDYTMYEYSTYTVHNIYIYHIIIDRYTVVLYRYSTVQYSTVYIYARARAASANRTDYILGIIYRYIYFIPICI